MDADKSTLETDLMDPKIFSERTVQSVPFDSLSDASPDIRLRPEWETYQVLVSRLLAEGHAGKYVLIKADQLIGIWDRHADAVESGYQRFAGEPFLVHEIRKREPIIRRHAVARCRG
ncbi:MAG: hypothetical protein EXS16_00510 [Gemmataceae bacterium]|nr:hypothetical protein [Gemmataceae bacterium]